MLGIVALAIVGLGYGLTSRDAAMESHATDLLEGLDAHAQERTLRLAMLPFRDLDFPIDADFADGIIAALERELLRRGRHEIVARDTIDAILADTAHREGGSFQYALIPNLLARAPEIDVVIRGRLRLSASEPELSFQAIDRNGKLVAASGGQSITLRPCPADAVCAARTLDQIIDSSSRTFHAQAPELHTLTLGGVRYQDSGAQPPFARYLQQRLVDALRLRYADAGTTLAIGEFDSAAPPTEPGTEMVLTGVYWAFVDLIGLRLALTELDGSALVWRGQLRRDGFNQANLLPPRDLRVRPETLCRITEFSEHESNGRELDEGERVAVEVLPVLGQSAAAVEPGDGAFDHPTPGLDDEALHPIGSLDDLGLEIGQDAGQGAVKDRPLIGAVGEQFPEKGKQTEQGRQQRETAVAILNVGGGDDAVQQQALRIDQNMPLLALDQLAGIEAVAVDASPPFSALFTL